MSSNSEFRAGADKSDDANPNTPMPPHLDELPNGMDLANHVARCLRMGCDQADVCRQLTAFGLSEKSAQQVVTDTRAWMQKNPNPGRTAAEQGESARSSAAQVPQGDELYYYVRSCRDGGSNTQEIRKQLIAFGYSAADSDRVIEDTITWSNASRRPPPPSMMPKTGEGNNGSTNMLVGGAICLVGIVITVGSYLAASEAGGGRYVLAWGAIDFGGIPFFRGLARSGQQ